VEFVACREDNKVISSFLHLTGGRRRVFYLFERGRERFPFTPLPMERLPFLFPSPSELFYPPIGTMNRRPTFLIRQAIAFSPATRIETHPFFSPSESFLLPLRSREEECSFPLPVSFSGKKRERITLWRLPGRKEKNFPLTPFFTFSRYASDIFSLPETRGPPSPPFFGSDTRGAFLYSSSRISLFPLDSTGSCSPFFPRFFFLFPLSHRERPPTFSFFFFLRGLRTKATSVPPSSFYFLQTKSIFPPSPLREQPWISFLPLWPYADERGFFSFSDGYVLSLWWKILLWFTTYRPRDSRAAPFTSFFFSLFEGASSLSFPFPVCRES